MSRVNRRTFIREATLAATALWARPMSTLLPSESPTAQNVIVVGAGMAGLAVAIELRRRGHEVTVLEARSRPGGRVLTLREPFADGLYAEVGAIQVYDSHRRVQRYLAELRLEIDPILPSSRPLASVAHVRGSRVLTRPGERASWPFALGAEEQGLDASSLSRKYVAPLLPKVQDAEARGALLATFGKYERMTFADFLREQGASEGAIAIISTGLASGLGDGSAHHSALNLLREAAHRALHKQSFTIRGGTDHLPRALATRIADRVHYGAPVVRLEQDADAVRAVVTQGGSTRTFTGDRLVCTIPFSVLRRVDVHPAFGREKRAAIEQLEYTSVTRTSIQTRTRFWLDDGLASYAATDLPVMGIYERSINQPGTRGILESYQAGPDARRAAAMPAKERVAMVLAEMTKVYPRISEQFEGGASKSWDDDEWARGAYAWFKPGQMSALMPHIARSEGRIHFAGDHTSATPGWMEGALESAERVVQEIVSVR